MMRALVLLASVIVAALIVTMTFFIPRLSHRAEGTLGVRELLEHGPDFEGKVVSVRGVVVTGVSVLWVGGYRLRDTSTDSVIFVVSDNGVPALRHATTATGIFKQGLTFGELRYGAIVPQGWCDLSRARNSVSQIVAMLCKTG